MKFNRRLVTVGASLAIAFAIPVPSHAQAPSLPSDIRRALLQNAQNLDPICVSWVWTMSHGTTPKQIWNRQLVLNDGKFYVSDQETKWRDTRKLTSSSEVAFDGDNFFSGNGNKTGLLKLRVDQYPKSPMVVLEYFNAAGVLVPTEPAELVNGKALSLVLKTIEKGQLVAAPAPAELAGVKVISVVVDVIDQWRAGALETDLGKVARGSRSWAGSDAEVNHELDNIRKMREMPELLRYTFYLDPALNYALRRLDISYPDGKVTERHDNSHFEQVGTRPLWLPRQCLVSRYLNLRPPEGFQFTETPIYPEEITVNRISTEIPADTHYALAYDAPGTSIYDKTAPDGSVKRYSIPIRLEMLAGDSGFGQVRTIFIVANIVIVTVLAGYLVRRKRIAR